MEIEAMRNINSQTVQPVTKPIPVVKTGNNLESNLETALDNKSDKKQQPQKHVNEPKVEVQGREQNSNEQMKKAVDSLNKKMSHSEAVYGFHEDTNRVIIKIIDKETKETIKEIPPEKTLDMIAKVWEIAGIMVDERR